LSGPNPVNSANVVNFINQFQISFSCRAEHYKIPAQQKALDVVRYFMRPISTIIFFIFCLLTLKTVGQNITKKYSLPGFVQLNDSVFISITEIDIREYGRFLTVWRKQSGDPNLINKALPSPNYLGWTYWNSYNKSVITYSDQYEIIDRDRITEQPKDTSISFTAWISNWPVVNITKQQANLYCDFRTTDYQVFYNSQKQKKKVKYPANLVFRLPTNSEWIYAASSGLDTTKYKYGVEGDKVKYSSPVSIETFINDTTEQSHPFPVTSGQMNKSKILNMCGNVAELVSDNEFVYGGSFLDPTANCTVTSKKLFTEPKSNIGFRIVAVIRNE